MNQILKYIVAIRKHLKDVSIESFGFKGTYVPKSTADIELLQNIKTHLRNCFYKETDNDVELDNIQLNSEVIVVT